MNAPQKSKAPKPKKCKICAILFMPQRMGQKVCSPKCAMTFARDMSAKSRKVLEKAERAADKEKLLSLKPLSYWADRAQKQVNRYVRLKEAGSHCISCGTPWDSTFQSGHYLSRGAHPELRFNLDNIHVQCIQCNHHRGGNASAYRINLVKLIGVDRVERLEGHNPLPKWTRDDYQRIEAEFKKLADSLMG